MSNNRSYYESFLSNQNVIAFLHVIAHCEGADYNIRFPGKTFNNYSDHPRIKERWSNNRGGRGISDASGRYQFISTTWDGLRRSIGANDFSPRNQDLGAIYLIKQARALDLIAAGRIVEALPRVAPVWASLPPYQYRGQGGKCPISKVLELFKKFSGKPLNSTPSSNTANGNSTNDTSNTNPDSVSSQNNPIPSPNGVTSSIIGKINCDPPPYTLKDRIVYLGCPIQVLSTPTSGTGYPFSAPPVKVLDKPSPPTIGKLPVNFKPVPGGFIRPTKGIISSAFGWRKHPISGKVSFHAGIDLAPPANTPVLSVADGIVIYRGWMGGYGLTIEIKHPNGLFTRYAHLNSMSVSNNQTVKQGTVIGLVGSTGNSTGPHLHFEVRTKPRALYQDSALNPLKFIQR